MKNEIPHRVHFVGIGGIGVSGLAQHLLKTGRLVSGSDRQQNNQTQKLQKMGVTLVSAESSDLCGAQLVVRSSAVPESNPQIMEARRLGIPVVLREELLGQIFDSFPRRIAICGTHGKTTVTAMIHHVLERCGVSHTAFIGGEYCGENYFFGSDVVVAEACEYKRSFLNLHPTVCACVNVEYDHPDCYENFADIQNAFRALFRQSKTVLLPEDCQTLCNGTKFVVGRDVSARNVVLSKGCASFDVLLRGEFVGRCNLTVVGAHNVANALTAVAVAAQLNLPMLQVIQALHTFCGVDRRWTEISNCVCRVVCDYAHHPTEIAATVNAAKNLARGKIVCVFQPHTYSRTRAFWADFVSCFDGADQVAYLPIYPARELPQKGVTSYGLYRLAKQCGKNVKYFSDFQRAANYLKKALSPNDLCLLIGAGDVNLLAKLLKENRTS